MASSYWKNPSVLQTLDLQQRLSVFGDIPDYGFFAISATIQGFFTFSNIPLLSFFKIKMLIFSL